MLPLVILVLAVLMQAVCQLTEAMLSSARLAALRVHAAMAAEAAASTARLGAAWLRLNRAAAAPTVAALGAPLEHRDPLGNRGWLLAPSWAAHPLGVEDESAKLALHALPLDRREQRAAREMLLQVPGMTVQLADAILDWLDADDRPRPFGAERSYYSGLGLPGPRNGRLASLDELLLVRGVTATLLYGADANRDGLATEDASISSEDFAGWSRYLSASARESTRRADGMPRIFLNGPSAYQLYDRLLPVLGADQAAFVAALRRYGPVEQDDPNEEAEDAADRQATVDARIAAQLGLESAEDEQAESATAREEIEAVATTDQDDEEEAKIKRAGIVLGGEPAFRIRSLADLCGREVQIRRGDRDETLTSPWPANAAGMRAAVQQLADLVTPFAGDACEGRVNVNQAPWQVLAALPGLSRLEARAIAVRARERASARLAGDAAAPTDPAWILEEGLLDWPRFRRIAGCVTGGGDVFVLRSVGCAGGSGHWEMLTIRVDRSTGSSEILSRTTQVPRALREDLEQFGRDS
jgi:type II secretory pathway component PulK